MAESAQSFGPVGCPDFSSQLQSARAPGPGHPEPRDRAIRFGGLVFQPGRSGNRPNRGGDRSD